MQDARLPRALAVAMCIALAGGGTPFWPTDLAWAQDDDGGGDDDDGASGGSGGSGNDGGTSNQPPPAQQTTTPSTTPAELPLFAADEIVTLALTDADLATLVAGGYRVLEERTVPEIGTVSRRLAIPDDTTLEAARAEVRALPSGTDADFNHYYRAGEASGPATCNGPHCALLDLIGWGQPAAEVSACTADIGIGVIDTGVNPDHPTFAGARLEVHRIAPDDLEPSGAVHGTAVISLLIGDPAGRSPGLLPGARVVAVDAFHNSGGDERADVYTLTAAMDFLAARDVRVVNMSLAGPSNTVLERATAALSGRGVVIVAATGNAGPQAEPAYPAAYPDVVAVTAVDGAGAVYRRAGRGSHVDLSAPGVDVWTAASVTGAKPKTGTSFAAPFVTAAAASLLAAEPQLSATDVVARLSASARDLGEAGYDDVYGHGLVQATQRCAP